MMVNHTFLALNNGERDWMSKCVHCGRKPLDPIHRSAAKQAEDALIAAIEGRTGN